MPAAGAGQEDAKAEQVTFDDVEDWFPHCSPNGKSLVFVSFPKEPRRTTIAWTAWNFG